MSTVRSQAISITAGRVYRVLKRSAELNGRTIAETGTAIRKPYTAAELAEWDVDPTDQREEHQQSSLSPSNYKRRPEMRYVKIIRSIFAETEGRMCTLSESKLSWEVVDESDESDGMIEIRTNPLSPLYTIDDLSALEFVS